VQARWREFGAEQRFSAEHRRRVYHESARSTAFPTPSDYPG
jgi:hypothetical protein